MPRSPFLENSLNFARPHPRGHGGGLFLCPGRPARQRPRPVRQRHGPGHWHGDSKLPRGRGHLPAPAARGPARLEKLPLRGALRRGGAHLRHFGRAGAGSLQPLLPWLLAFAAGAMLYVVVEELIPEAHLGEHSNVGTLGVMAGFLVMMVLDTALG